MEMQKPSDEGTQLIENEDVEDERRCSRCCQFPLSIYFIVVNEFCERFCYYGMRAVLVLYLTHYIGLNSADAMGLYHFWVVLTYVTPLMGGYVADNFFGKFNTILVLSIVYLLGTIIMASTAAIPPNLAGPIIGLLLISIGSGGIKSSTSALGGDQIPPDKTKLLDSFFSVFYFTINAGALLSTIITPIFRARVHCGSEETCYPLAFGMSSILMGVAIIVFAVGKSRYIIRPGVDRAVGRFVSCTWHGFKRYIGRERKLEDPDASWMDYASDEYSEEEIQNVKKVHRIFVLFLPMIIFWSLYDQQSSRWTLQASLLDGYVTRGITILPDQMTFVNASLILLFIPLFESVIYPLVEKCGIKDKPLRRMGVGLLITVSSFLMAFVLQLWVETTLVYPPSAGHARLKLISMEPNCNLVAPSMGLQTPEPFKASAPGVLSSSTLGLGLQLDCGNGTIFSSNANVNFTSQKDYLIFGWKNDGGLRTEQVISHQNKDKNGHALIRTAYIDGRLPFTSLVLSRDSSKQMIDLQNNNTVPGDLVLSPFVQTKRNDYSLLLQNTKEKKVAYLGTTKIYSGEVAVFLPHSSGSSWTFSTVTEVPGNNISIAWQLPQYILITAGEILVSITGLSFSYAEAPQSLKATVSAIWLLYTGLGNLIVAIVSELNVMPRDSWNYLLFSILGLVTTLIFAILAYFYQPIETKKSYSISKDDVVTKEE